MLVEKFKKAKEIILHVEKEFPINDWKLNGVQIWPFIRIQLFFFIIDPPTNKVDVTSNKNNDTPNQKPLIFLSKLLFYIKFKSRILGQFINYLRYSIWLKQISNKKFLFIGHNHHRVDHLDKRFNRFYDPLIEKYNLKSQSNIVEYWAEDETNIMNLDLSVNYEKGKDLYKKCLPLLQKLGKAKAIYKLENEDYENFLEYLDNTEITKGFSNNYKNLTDRYKVITNYYSFYQNLLNKTNPKYIFTLCYYIDELMLLLHIANTRKIETIEMQHGPIAQDHLSYGYWSNIPANGYLCMPKKYWCWDASSKLSIDKLSQNSNGFYSAFIGGHPWVDYWRNKEVKFPYGNIILYTLQPMLSPQELFPDTIINVIKSKKNKWLIRLHPRQLEQKKELVEYLKDKQVLDLVDIELGTSEALPILLKNTLLHVTHSSGATLEAALFNIKTVLLNDLGKQYYTDLLNENKAIYLQPDSPDFEISFTATIEEITATYNVAKENKVDSEVVNKIFTQQVA